MDVEPWYSESGAKGKSMRRILIGWLVVTALAARALGQGTILWDEAVNGPISSDIMAPTVLGPFHHGTNSVIGSVSNAREGNLWFGPEDFFAFQIPSLSSLDAIYVSVDKSDAWTWFGDSSFSVQFGFVTDSSNGDLITQWEIAPIGTGTYGMYLASRNHSMDSSVTAYHLNFVVRSIPEPATLWLLLGGLGCLGFHRWRKI